jgi:predicted phosphodiesterase
VLADTHLGAWSTDYELFMRITDEIHSIPNLYLCLLGDMAHMAIKMRSMEEVQENLLPPDLQLMYLESWLSEMQHRVLASCWGNHDTEREQQLTGGSRIVDLYRKMVPYFDGIGIVDLQVGEQAYSIAMSHRFPGRGANPVQGPMSYLLKEGLDQDIAIAGDSHVPGIMTFNHGSRQKLAVNCGSIQTDSGYAKRYFSLLTAPIFPCFTLDPQEKIMNGYWSLANYLRR